MAKLRERERNVCGVGGAWEGESEIRGERTQVLD